MGSSCSVGQDDGDVAVTQTTAANVEPQTTTTLATSSNQPTIAVTSSATHNPLVVPPSNSADQPSLHARSVVDPLRPLDGAEGVAAVGVETPNSSGAQPNDSADSSASSLNSNSSDIIGGVVPDTHSPTKAGERARPPARRPPKHDGAGNPSSSAPAPAQRTPQQLLRDGDDASGSTTTTATNTTTTTTNTSTNTTSAASLASSFNHTPAERRVSGGDIGAAFTPVVASSMSSSTTLANASLTPRTGSDVFLPPRTQRRLTAEIGADAASKRSSLSSSTSTGHSVGSKGGGSVQGHALELAKLGSSSALQLRTHSSNLSADWHDDHRGSVDGRRSSSVSISSPTSGSTKTGVPGGGSFRQRRVVLDSAASPTDDGDKGPATLVSPSSPYRHQRVPSHSAAMVDDDPDGSPMSRFRPSPPRAMPSYQATGVQSSSARSEQRNPLDASTTPVNDDDDTDTAGTASREALVGRLRLNTSLVSSVQSTRLKHDNSSTSLRGVAAVPIHAHSGGIAGDEEFPSARASSHHLRHGPGAFQLEPSLSRSGAGSAMDLLGDSLSTPMHSNLPQPHEVHARTQQRPSDEPGGPDSPVPVVDTRTRNPALSPPNYRSGASAEENVIQVQRRVLVAVAPEQMLYGNDRSSSVDSFSGGLQMAS